MDHVRHLERREPVQAVRGQRVSVGVGVERHRGAHQLAVLLVGHTEARGIDDCRVRAQHVLDLGRRDVLSTAEDHLLQAADEGEVAVPVYRAQIAGAEPAIDEPLGVGFRVAEVAGCEPRPSDQHLTCVAQRQLGARLVGDADLRASGDADRGGPRRRWRERVRGDLMARLGHAVGLEQRRLEAGLDPSHELRGQRGAAGPQEAQPARRRAALPLEPLEHHLMERRPRGEPGDAGGLELVEHALRREARRDDHPAAAEQRGKHGRHETMHVEQRHRHERPVLGAEAVVPCNRPRGGHQVAVRERDLLGAAGGAARVEQEGDVVRLRGLEVLRRAHVPAVHLHAARAAVLDEELADADPDAARCPGRRGLVGGEEREPRVQVLHEEHVLVVRVGRVQRGGRRSERDDGQQGLEKNRPIGNDQHDAIAPGHARGAQDAGHLPHRLGQAAEIETQPVGDVQRRRGRRAAEQRRERLISLGSRGQGGAGIPTMLHIRIVGHFISHRHDAATAASSVNVPR